LHGHPLPPPLEQEAQLLAVQEEQLPAPEAGCTLPSELPKLQAETSFRTCPPEQPGHTIRWSCRMTSFSNRFPHCWQENS